MRGEGGEREGRGEGGEREGRGEGGERERGEGGLNDEVRGDTRYLEQENIQLMKTNFPLYDQKLYVNTLCFLVHRVCLLIR